MRNSNLHLRPKKVFVVVAFSVLRFPNFIKKCIQEGIAALPL